MTRMVDDVLSQEHRRELVSTPEWNSVCAKQHNVVFEGPERETEGLLQLLEPHLQAPAVWKRAPMPLELQTDECGTLVVQEVSALGRHEQAALLKWLDRPGDRRQVVSTTIVPLFPLLARGLFDETLYYRLNVVLLLVDSTGASV